MLGFSGRGGWKCQFYFYGRGDFSENRLTLSRAPEKQKGFSFLSCGATWSRTVPKTQRVRVAVSLLEKSGSEVPAIGDFGGRKLPGEGRGEKKGKKDAQKKVGRSKIHDFLYL